MFNGKHILAVFIAISFFGVGARADFDCQFVSDDLQNKVKVRTEVYEKLVLIFVSHEVSGRVEVEFASHINYRPIQGRIFEKYINDFLDLLIFVKPEKGTDIRKAYFATEEIMGGEVIPLECSSK